MSLRLLHFTDAGDTSGFFPQLARWHDRGRYRMFFGTLGPMAPELQATMERESVATLSLGCRNRAQYMVAWPRLARVLRKQAIDILHVHLFDPSVVGLLAGTLAGVPCRVMTRHYSDYHTRIDKHWHVRLDRLCTRLAHGVVAVSRHTAEHLVHAESAPPAKVHVILNGIDFDRVKLSSAEAPARLRREHLEGDGYLLLTAARLHPEKGYEHAFAAIPELRRRLDHPFRWLIAGTGGFESSFRAQVAAVGGEDVVRFLGFRRDLPDLMAAADLFVLPSVAEAFGLVLAEALHLGVPVVATRVGGIPEIVDDGIDGTLVPAADPASLAEAIADLLLHPDKRRRFAGAGRAKVATRFSFESMVRAYEAYYETLRSRP
jgi:glycosyltransferase involved in cell wall biosynthesis